MSVNYEVCDAEGRVLVIYFVVLCESRRIPNSSNEVEANQKSDREGEGENGKRRVNRLNSWRFFGDISI